MRALLIVSLVMWASSAVAAPAGLPRGLCAIENATYRLVGQEQGTTLRFVDDPKLARQSALSAVLRSPQTKRTYRFTFAASNGYSTQYLIPVLDKPTESEADGNEGLSFYMFDTQLQSVELPQPGESAPPYLFVPDLGKTLWYGSMNDGKREMLDTGMWRRAECGR